MTKEAEDIVEKWGVIKQMRQAQEEMVKKMEKRIRVAKSPKWKDKKGKKK